MSTLTTRSKKMNAKDNRRGLHFYEYTYHGATQSQQNVIQKNPRLSSPNIWANNIAARGTYVETRQLRQTNADSPANKRRKKKWKKPRLSAAVAPQTDQPRFWVAVRKLLLFPSARFLSWRKNKEPLTVVAPSRQENTLRFGGPLPQRLFKVPPASDIAITTHR